MNNHYLLNKKMSPCALGCEEWIEFQVSQCPNLKECMQGAAKTIIVEQEHECIWIGGEEDWKAKEFCLCEVCPYQQFRDEDLEPQFRTKSRDAFYDALMDMIVACGCNE
jgi:hypothetical protein